MTATDPDVPLVFRYQLLASDWEKEELLRRFTELGVDMKIPQPELLLGVIVALEVRAASINKNKRRRDA